MDKARFSWSKASLAHFRRWSRLFPFCCFDASKSLKYVSTRCHTKLANSTASIIRKLFFLNFVSETV
jgi:hypothetical protein